MFLLYFTNAFQSSITSNLSAYITSGFESHSLIPVIQIVSNVMSGAAYLPVAKFLDVWGRPLGFAMMATIATLGLILSAVCKDIETYCAAQVPPPVILSDHRMLTISAGLLLGRVHGHDLLRGRHHVRHVVHAGSWPGLCLHVVAVHHHRLRRPQGGRGLLREQLALGVRLLGHRAPCRGCPALLHAVLQPEEGGEERPPGQGAQRTDLDPEHRALHRGVRL